MANITDAEIEYVATAMSAAGPGQSGHILSGLARAALTATAELGWGKKPTRSELNDLLLSQYDQTAHSSSHSAVIGSIQQLLHAGYAVDD